MVVVVVVKVVVSGVVGGVVGGRFAVWCRFGSEEDVVTSLPLFYWSSAGAFTFSALAANLDSFSPSTDSLRKTMVSSETTLHF